MIILSNVKSQQVNFQKPDYDSINKKIQDSSSVFYYPKLMSRLENYDTTLTNEEYRYLYYGYVHQKEYSPYWSFSEATNLNEYYQKESLAPADTNEIIKLCNQAIKECPFDLKELSMLTILYHQMGKEDMAYKLGYRFNGIIDAILSTGDGRDCETAFYVISTTHEYSLLNLFEFKSTGQALDGQCDLIKIQKDQRNVESMYFNVNILFVKNRERMNKNK